MIDLGGVIQFNIPHSYEKGILVIEVSLFDILKCYWITVKQDSKQLTETS